MRLMIFSKGDNRDYAPLPPMLLFFRSRVRIERLRRFAMGDNRDYSPMSPILL